MDTMRGKTTRQAGEKQGAEEQTDANTEQRVRQRKY